MVLYVQVRQDTITYVSASSSIDVCSFVFLYFYCFFIKCFFYVFFCNIVFFAPSCVVPFFCVFGCFVSDVRVPVSVHLEQPRGGGFAKEARQGLGRGCRLRIPLALASPRAEADQRRRRCPRAGRHRLRFIRVRKFLRIFWLWFEYIASESEKYIQQSHFLFFRSFFPIRMYQWW